MQKQKIQVSPDGNLVFNPSRSIDNLMNLNYSTKWKFIPHVDDGKFAILIATPILGYTDLTKKTQIHYFSSYVDAEIKALGQSKYEEYETIK